MNDDGVIVLRKRLWKWIWTYIVAIFEILIILKIAESNGADWGVQIADIAHTL